MYKLQDIILNNRVEIDGTGHMYYRSPHFIYTGAEGESIINKNGWTEFFTYFNALSVEKWKKYTYATKFFLVLEARGKFAVELFGHYLEKGTDIKKEWLGKYVFDLKERERIVLPYPVEMQSMVVAFLIRARKKTHVFHAYYAADLEKGPGRDIYIALATTTFKKEAYMERNMDSLKKHIFSDPEYAGGFCWNIVDNGRSIPEQKDCREPIRVFHNKNVGGAGGFARGMIESLRQPKAPTHILLMDDDVVFSPESFKRLYKMLNILRPEYKRHFVSGAMLKMGAPNIQHEDTGRLNAAGYHEAVKPNLDLNLWDSVLVNEKIADGIPHQYAAWWFCCIPAGVARLDNLPLPVFVRGDDVEYSLRNQAEFITMNGLCIWHEGFEGKFSAALEYYQVERNELVLCAMHPELDDVDVIGHIRELFWQELFKFNYKGAALLLDAVEDYLKGPDYFFSLDLYGELQKKRGLDNQLKPMPDQLKQSVDYDSLYVYENLPGWKKALYDYTCNGQCRVPEFFARKKAGIIPYGWGYFQKKQFFTKTNYAIDAVGGRYTVYKKDRKVFGEMKRRFDNLMEEYERRHEEVEVSYKKYLNRVTDIEFWDKYLQG